MHQQIQEFNTRISISFIIITDDRDGLENSFKLIWRKRTRLDNGIPFGVCILIIIYLK
jgi:hypothetical protein